MKSAIPVFRQEYTQSLRERELLDQSRSPTSLDSGHELRWIVAMDAALFFSAPCWLLAVNRAWPADGPYQFILALLVGASTAVVLCHITPAIYQSTIRTFFASRIGRLLRWPIGAWFCIGAMASLLQMARLAGSMFALWRDGPQFNEPVWHWGATALAVICVVASLAIAAKRRWSHQVIAVSLATGVCLSLAGLLAQSPGLGTANPQMTSEVGLNEPLAVADGMLMSATPAAILALRIGRMGLSRKRIVWAGVLGVWLPLLASVALVALAKMCGARLYWKPSVPIEFQFAFLWLFQSTGRLATVLWPLAVTVLAPCVVCACWVADFTLDWEWRWAKLVTLATIAVVGYAMASSFAWALYYRYWLWSIAGACLLLGLARLALSLSTIISTKLR